MKVGDLCKFVGTTGWGTICIVVEVDVWDDLHDGQIRVFSDTGRAACIAAGFLEVIG